MTSPPLFPSFPSTNSAREHITEACAQSRPPPVLSPIFSVVVSTWDVLSSSPLPSCAWGGRAAFSARASFFLMHRAFFPLNRGAWSVWVVGDVARC